MIILQSSFRLFPEKVDEALGLMREMMRLCRHEHGCRHYVYFQEIADPSEILLLQEWDDADSLQGHYETDHMKRFVGRLGPLLRSPITTRSYVSQDGESILDADEKRAPGTRQSIH